MPHTTGDPADSCELTALFQGTVDDRSEARLAVAVALSESVDDVRNKILEAYMEGHGLQVLWALEYLGEHFWHEDLYNYIMLNKVLSEDEEEVEIATRLQALAFATLGRENLRDWAELEEEL